MSSYRSSSRGSSPQSSRRSPSRTTQKSSHRQSTRPQVNIGLIGAASTGKTTFIERVKTGDFTRVYTPTVGINERHSFIHESEKVRYYESPRIKFFDFPGQERNMGSDRSFRNKMDYVFLFCASDSKRSFHEARDHWLPYILETQPQAKIFLLCNKADIKDPAIKINYFAAGLVEMKRNHEEVIGGYLMSCKSNYHLYSALDKV